MNVRQIVIEFREAQFSLLSDSKEGLLRTLSADLADENWKNYLGQDVWINVVDEDYVNTRLRGDDE